MSGSQYYSRASSSSNNLFKALQVGTVKVQHRIAMAPLTRFRSPNHVPLTDLVGEYYEQRAQYPGTLIVSEATYISPKAVGYPGAAAPGIWSKEQVAAWKDIYSRIHKKDSFIFTQLWALGRAGEPSELKRVGQDFVAPSAVPRSDIKDQPPRALSVDEIKEYIQDYVKAAKNAIEAGADGVEIHGANGYLPDQFLHDNTNKRTDQYGGSLENRARFILEIVDAVIAAVGANKVAIRLSPWGTFGDVSFDVSPIPQYSYLVSELQRRANDGNQLAYIHLVEPRVDGSGDADESTLITDKNAFLGDIWKGVIIRAGNVKDYVNEVANIDDRTIAALGRYFIANPDLVSRIENKKELNKYNRATFYWDGKADPASGYTDYPSA